MLRIILAVTFLLGLAGGANAAGTCPVPNPNLLGPPFVDNCPIPASVLNKLSPTLPAAANLRLTTTVNFPAGVWRLAYAVPGDTQPMFYVPGVAACGTDDGGGCINSSNGKSWVAVIPPTGYDPTEWGVSNADVDSTTAMQAVFTYACANNGGTVKFGTGTFKAHDISVPCASVHVIGSGPGKSIYSGSNINSPDNSGTTIDCTAMSSFCLRFRPNPYPGRGRMTGDSAEKLSFSMGTASGNMLEFDQVDGGYARDIQVSCPSFACSSLNLITLIGVEHFHVSDIRPANTSGTVVDVSGNLTGYNSSGSACTLGDCSTRTDTTTIERVESGGNSAAGIGVSIHDQAFDISVNHFTFENGATGLNVSCAAGQASVAYCPQQLFFDDFEAEGATTPADLSDFTWVRIHHSYFTGVSASVTANDLRARLVNYTQAGNGGGGLLIDSTEMFNANHSCVLGQVSDITITNSAIAICDTANDGSAAIEVNKAHNVFSGNTLCSWNGTTSGAPNGILLNTGASLVTLGPNLIDGCQAAMVNTAGVTVEGRELFQPPDALAASALTGATGLGTGGSAGATLFSGNAHKGLILLTAGSSGAAANGNITLNSLDKFEPGYACTAQGVEGTAAWLPPNGINALTTSATSVQFEWYNASALTASQTYFIFYTCGNSN